MCGRSKTWRRLTAALAALAMAVSLAGATRAMAAGGERMLIPVGHTIGIKLFARGVVVANVPEGKSPARSCGLRAGDVILSCGGQDITSTEQFQSLLQQGDTSLEVKRDQRQLDLNVEPKKNDQGVYCIGAWVRDSMAGIGTVTYYDPASREFGALGHGITDVDTAQLMPFGDGSVLPSTVKAVKRGAVGSAGELRGDFDLSGDLGPLRANTESGIFGHFTGPVPKGEAIPTGAPHPGEATILSNIEGDKVGSYTVEICSVKPDDPKGRNLQIAVTDPELLAATGGIVQGMSGSPIIQDGHLVGAVTHVFLNDPTKGYGISINSMLNAAV